ncbi:MAG: carboxylating nicotinate-nucleotide diphosphorylase [Candidatus Saganbacteria bacterium]|nr:carboxylating nicotinate-nucleotide diphosphorylase [Candidatus Saganbacteria bacterium]
MKLDERKLQQIVKKALEEDIGLGDITTEAVVPAGKRVEAEFVVKAKGVIAGLPVAEEVFKALDPSLQFEILVNEGSHVKPGTKIALVKGKARSILTAERVALNFLQRLSGIATLTAEFMHKVRGKSVRILDTRKTTPGLRFLEKYAVAVGGGTNHRMGLSDAVLIKDNHIAAVGDLFEAVQIARRNLKATTPIEVETSNLDEVREALDIGADKILLDNMHPRMMSKAVKMVREHNHKSRVTGSKVETEASGGVSLRNVRRIARTGVDAISIGALTHSPKALDISLEIKR